MAVSVFAPDHNKVWPFRYACTLQVHHMSGGVPNDPKVIKGWLTARLFGKDGRDNELAHLVAKTAQERGIDLEKDPDKALAAVDLSNNGFKCVDGGLVFEGRCVKAAIKEYFSIAGATGGVPTGKGAWGTTGKGLVSFIAEHIQVPEEFIPMLRLDGTPFPKPDGVDQRFVSTHHGQGISYTDYVNDTLLSFTVEADHDFDKYWPTIWVKGEKNGIGSLRSQGSGKFVVVQWDRIEDAPPKRRITRKAS